MKCAFLAMLLVSTVTILPSIEARLALSVSCFAAVAALQGRWGDLR